MRKIITCLCLIALCMQVTFAQRSELFISNNRLFYEGQSMYNNSNYAGCVDKLTEYKKRATDADLLQESDFMLAASAFRQGRPDALTILREYLDSYPESRHYDETCFMIGSCHFADKDYKIAIFWLEKADMDNLSLKNQEDCAYRQALSYLQTNKKDDARRLFGILKDNSARYRDAATYYTGYLYYSEGKYDNALPLLSQLKNNKEFQPDVLYYLVQINFIQKRYTQTIKEGTALLNNYPHHAGNIEANRIVGVSYYNESDYANAAKFLSQYAQTCSAPLRNDMYLLGLSYFNLKNYQSAADYLSKSNPGNDTLGQNTYMYLGQSYLNLGDQKNALMAFESASRMDFDSKAKETSMYNYAMLLHKNSVSAFGESVTILENFLNTYPKSIYSDKINDCLVEVYLTTKNYNTALKSIDKIKNPGRKILEAKQKIYYHLGTVDFTNTEYSTAVGNFTKAIAAGDYAPEEKEKAIYWRGESYYRQEQYDSAIKDYNAFLQTAQKKSELSPLAQYNLGYCYFKKQQYAAAQSAFNAYISQEQNKANPSLADAYARLGDCLFFNRRFSEAESAYSQSSSLQPAAADYAVFQKGFIMGLQKDYKGKIAQMDKLMGSFPDSRYLTDAMYEKGRAYVMMENNPSAIRSYEELLVKYPESSSARKAGIQIGLLYFNSNEPQKAAEAYKKVIEKYPGSEEAKVAVQDLKSVYFDLNDVSGYADYLKSLGGSVKFEASEQDSLTYLAAEQFFMKNDIKKAQDGMKKYLSSFPDGAFSNNAHYYLGRTYYNQKEFALAKTEFSKVAETSNNRFTEEALLYLGDLQYQDKEYDAALLSYQRLQNVAENKSHKEAGNLGVMRSAFQLNKYTDIINSSNALLKEANLDPETAIETRYYRAKAYLGLKEGAKASADLIELSKDTRTVFGAEAKYLLAQYYFDNKESGKAENEVLDYIKKGTPHSYWLARGFILLSDVYISKNDSFKAKQYLESLQHNYKNTDDDIHTMINQRLTSINQK